MSKDSKLSAKRWGPFAGIDDRFSPDVVAVEGRPLPKSVTILFVVLLLLLIAAIVWATFARVDRVVETEATLVSRHPRQLIRPLSTSVIADMPVRAGNVFRAGDVLVRFNPTLSSADYNLLKALVHALRLEQDRLRFESKIKHKEAALLDVPASVSWAGTLQEDIFRMRLSEWRNRQAGDVIKKANLEQSRRAMTERLALITTQVSQAEIEVAIKKKGVEAGLVPRDQLFERQVQLLALKGNLIELREEVDQVSLQVQLIETELQGFIASFRRNASEELEDVSRTLAEKEEQLQKAEYLGSHDKIVATFDGVVLDAMERAAGTVVQPSDTLLITTRFADDTDLEVEATIRPRDAGWVRVGMPVRVRLVALPSSKHGSLIGEVYSISADAVQGRTQIGDSAPRRAEHPGEVGYRAIVRITANRLKKLPADFTLSPGMLATAEIIIGDRRPYEYFLEPLLEGASRALTEAN